MTSRHLDLVARDVSVQFEGLKAFSSVTLAVPRGRITGLIGPNGAGKTTLDQRLDRISDALAAGTVELEGETVNGIAAHKLRQQGRGPHLSIGPPFSRVAGSGQSGSHRRWPRSQTRRDAIAEAERVMDWLGISHLAGARLPGPCPTPTSGASPSAAPSCAIPAICCWTSPPPACPNMKATIWLVSSSGSPEKSGSACSC